MSNEKVETYRLEWLRSCVEERDAWKNYQDAKYANTNLETDEKMSELEDITPEQMALDFKKWRIHHLPEHMRKGVWRYLSQGVEPGGFLRAALENKLVEAFGAADGKNIEAMRDWAKWLYNYCPVIAWGSKDRVDEWIALFKKEAIEI